MGVTVLGFWELAFPVLDDLMGCGMVHPFGPGWLLTTILRPLKLPEIMHDDHELLQVCGGGCKDAATYLWHVLRFFFLFFLAVVVHTYILVPVNDKIRLYPQRCTRRPMFPILLGRTSTKSGSFC